MPAPMGASEYLDLMRASSAPEADHTRGMAELLIAGVLVEDRPGAVVGLTVNEVRVAYGLRPLPESMPWGRSRVLHPIALPGEPPVPVRKRRVRV